VGPDQRGRFFVCTGLPFSRNRNVHKRRLVPLEIKKGRCLSEPEKSIEKKGRKKQQHSGGGKEREKAAILKKRTFLWWKEDSEQESSGGKLDAH